MYKYFDKNGDGVLSWREFLETLREPMSARKALLVQKIWQSLNPVDDSIDLSKVDNDQFKQALGQSDGSLSKSVFNDFYSDLAM